MKKIVLGVVLVCALAVLSVVVYDNLQFYNRLQSALYSDFSESYPSLTRVEYELLRKRPTVTGVAVPKYYVWVRLYSRDGLLDEAAIRCADDVEGFSVLQVRTREEIRRDPNVLDVFPKALIPDIEKRAGVVK